MTANPECATLETTILDALHIMHDGKFLHLPIVDRDGWITACVDVLQITHATISMLLERALEACGNDLDSTIKSLNDLRLGSVESNIGLYLQKYMVGLFYLALPSRLLSCNLAEFDFKIIAKTNLKSHSLKEKESKPSLKGFCR